MGKGHHVIGNLDVAHSEGDAIVASFTNSSKLPETVGLELYTSSKNPNHSILHGESKDKSLQYDADELTDSKYVIGVYDSKSKSIKLLKNTKMFSGRVSATESLISDAKLVKKLKRKNLADEGTFSERRNALGEEFGTKKAKKAITEAARNRIDAAMLEDSQIDIVDGIRQTTKSMPDREQMAKMVEKENRVIPPCHADATNVEEIYPIEEIVPDEILGCFPVDIFFSAKVEGDEYEEGEEKDEILSKLKYLPYIPAKERGSSHQKKSIFGRLISNILSERSSLSDSTNISDDMRWKLQLLSFTSMLVGLYFNRRLNRRDKLMAGYHNVPPARAINYMLQVFGNSKINNSSYDREIRSFNIGPKEEDKLLCYIIILLLSLFEFRMELSTLAADLSLKPSKLLALVRTLGCTVMVANKSDGKDMSGSKVAVLRVPFKVPDLVRRFRR